MNGQNPCRVYQDGDIQITTGAYSLHKTDDIILNESLHQDPNAILIQNNNSNIVDSANTSSAQSQPAQKHV